MVEPPDQMPAAAGRSHLRVSHADREQVIEALKAAFVDGRLTRDELGARAGRALSARTCADLAALTADIPPAPAAAGPTRPPAPARRRPLARAAAKSGTCLIIAFPAFWVGSYFDPFGPWRAVMDVLAVCGLWTAVGIMGYALFTAWDQKSPRKQLPPRPGPGSHALDGERRGAPGHGPVPPGHRTGQARADLRSDTSWPRWPHSSGRGVRTPRGIRPVPDSG